MNEQTLNLQRGFMPKQLEFLHASEDPGASEILFDGAIRSGKTQACCWWIFKQAVKAGGIYLIARNTYDQLRDSTRKVFAEGDGGLTPTCPQRRLHPNRGRRESRIMSEGWNPSRGGSA